MITTAPLTADRIMEYLEKGKRFDGRGLDEFRELTIETGISKNAEGSARVKCF
jgi:exosome complex component RRP42